MRDNYFTTFLFLCLIVIVSGTIVRPLEDEDNSVRLRRSPQRGTYPNIYTGTGQYPNYGNTGTGQYPNYGLTGTGYNPNYSNIRTGQYPNYGSTGTGGQNTYRSDWLYPNRPSAPQGSLGNVYPTLTPGSNYPQYYPNYGSIGSRQNPNYVNTATGQYPNYGSTGTGGQNTYQSDWLYPNRPSAPKWSSGNLYPTLTPGSNYPQYYPESTLIPHSNQGYKPGTTYPGTPGSIRPGGYYDANSRFGQPGFIGTHPTYGQPGNQNPYYGPGGYQSPGYGTVNPSQYPNYGSNNPNRYPNYGNTGQRKY